MLAEISVEHRSNGGNTLPPVDLSSIEAKIGFKLPEVDLESLEAKIGFELPAITTSDTKDVASQSATPASPIEEEPATPLPQPEQHIPATSDRVMSDDNGERTTEAAPELIELADDAANNKPTRRRFLQLGGTALALGVGYAILPEVVKGNKRQASGRSPSPTTPSTITAPSTTTTEIATTSTTSEVVPEIPMADRPLEIIPPENFLTPEGNFVKEDFRITIPSIDADIKAFVRPESEFSKIGELNMTPIDTLRPAEHSTRVTPQVAEYKRAHKNFIPTAERKKRSNGDMWYWDEKTAGEFQKAGMLMNKQTIYPGRLGNSAIMLHGSTKSAGGGDLPALKAGDKLTLGYTVDGNVYEFEFIERELIEIDKHGMLTANEIQRLVDKGYDSTVTADQAVKVYAGYKDRETIPTLTLAICSDREGTPGGKSGAGASTARALYRFKLTGADRKILYPTV